MKNYKEFTSSLSEDERMARADFKVGPSGRKSHKEIVFKDGSAEQEDEKKEVKEEVELEEATDTVVKDKTGKIISFKHEGDWKKANPKKNPEGQIHNLAGKALQKAKNLNKEEVELEENAPVAPGLVKHRIGVTVSDPNATSVTARKEKVQKFVRVTHSSNKEGAQRVGEKHFKKKGYVVHDSWHAGMVNEEVISEGAYEKAEENKKSADAAKKQGDMFAHHLHMADHHDNMAEWHASKGRHSEADRHAEKSEQHHEKAMTMKEEVELEEGYVVRYNNPKSEKHGSEKHFTDQAAAQKHADRGNSVDKIGGKYTVHKTNEKGHDIKEQAELDEAEHKTYGYQAFAKNDKSQWIADGTVKAKSPEHAKKLAQAKHPGSSAHVYDMKEEVDVLDEAVESGNKGYGYHGAHPSETADKEYSKAHSTVKKVAGEAGHLKDAKKPNQMVKHYLDSRHGRHLADVGTHDHEYIKKDFGKFKKNYKPEMHEGVDFDQEGNLMAEKKTYAQFMEQLLEYTPGPGGVTRVQGRSYGAQYHDPEGDDDADDKPKAKPAADAPKRGRGRPAGSKSGANQKVTSGKSYGGIATHSLHLPNTKR